MPIAKELEEYDREIRAIEAGLEEVKKKGDYTEKDVTEWQERLRRIDANYKEGYFVPQNVKEGKGRGPLDPYELEGQAELEERLQKCHDLAHELLEKLE